MSKSKPTPASAKPTTTRATARNSRGKRPKAAPPWIEGGIDYGPALVAVDELLAWAFDVTAASVADWPAALRRLKNARHFIRGVINGKPPRHVPEADLVFTAALMARIFDADLELGMSDIITVLSELGLPTVDAPRPSRAVPRGTRAAAPLSIADLTKLVRMSQGAAPAPVVPPRFPGVTRAGQPIAATTCAACPHGLRAAS